MPRLIGVGFKRIPKFGILLGLTFLTGDENPGVAAAFGASIGSAPFINPIRMIEKQQRAYFRQTGATKPIMDILKESAAKKFAPLFRGTVPLMGHSLASALLGLVGQPKLQRCVLAATMSYLAGRCRRVPSPPSAAAPRRLTNVRTRGVLLETSAPTPPASPVAYSSRHVSLARTLAAAAGRQVCQGAGRGNGLRR